MSPHVLNLLTAAVILLLILLIATYDLTMIYFLGYDYTISRVVRAWGEYFPLLLPLVAFAMGALYGHLFLP